VYPVVLAVSPADPKPHARGLLALSVESLARWDERVGHVYIDADVAGPVRAMLFIRADSPASAANVVEAVLDLLRQRCPVDFHVTGLRVAAPERRT
jgi:hypothetical protein